MQILKIGEPVPFPPFDGVRISLFTQGHNILFIGLDTPTLSEKKAFSDESRTKMAVISYENCLTLYFKIGNFSWQECTYNPGVIERQYLDRDAIEDSQNYCLLNAVLFDSRTGKIEAMRSFTLNREATSVIQKEVKDMLENPNFSNEEFIRSYEKLIKAGNVDEILKMYQPTIYECGAQ